MYILSNIHRIRFFYAEILQWIFRLILDLLILIRCRIVNEYLLLLKILKVIANIHNLLILFNYIIWLRHWKICFFVIFRRMHLALSIFLALHIWWCNHHTFSLNHHLLILFLHYLQFLLKYFFFVYILLILLLCLQSLAERVLVRWVKSLHLILLILEWILKSRILKCLIVLLYIYKITNVLTICVLSLAIDMRIILIVELCEIVTRILVGSNLLGLHLHCMSCIIVLKICTGWVQILLIQIHYILLLIWIVYLIRRVFVLTFIFVIYIVSFNNLIWESYREICSVSFYNRVVHNFILMVDIMCEWILP